MALDYSTDNVTNKGSIPPSSPHSAREVYRAMGKVTLDDAVELNDLIGLVAIPGDCIPTGCELICGDLDVHGTPTIVLDVGILNSDKDDLVASSELIDGSTVAQAGGVARMDSKNCAHAPATWLAETDCPAISTEKIVTAKVVTAPATSQAGSVYFSLDYRSAENGV